ncbi:copper resistance protein NlpE N-terminal domain-containing protein [Dyadobacter sp. LHD-138]|uniref:copper resistance protein NlpE N-terminal domain-containing protein n=1 Tax=Dyadobacter sp. LHD-138 TaxID=3071413 RepID=UPI0027E1C436|nr:copper resistance protein NlpE N-terminal domain-containing protein [Dyadobacter sp. LHD-138]MDQ6481117.1 copper resistance protein NlpE N-terminal domain-containing protein [Dyadobacter sp. LHD-138]
MKKILVIFLIALCVSVGNVSGQKLVTRNSPSKTTMRSPIAEGPDVWGVFHGRVPCQAMATAMGLDVPSDCEKLKWGFTFYQDPKNHQPTTYTWEGSLYRENVRKGKWIIVKGTKDFPDATVIQLDPDKPQESFFLLKGDDNVLFILDRNKNLMVGGSYLSYTFNRVVN